MKPHHALTDSIGLGAQNDRQASTAAIPLQPIALICKLQMTQRFLFRVFSPDCALHSSQKQESEQSVAMITRNQIRPAEMHGTSLMYCRRDWLRLVPLT